MKTLMDGLSLMICYVDRDLRYRFNNQLYENWTGMSHDEIKGKTIKEVLGNETYELIRDDIKRALSGLDVSFQREFVFKKTGRRYLRLNFVPHKNGIDDVVDGIYIMIQDITELLKSDNMLATSEAFLKSTIETIPDSIVTRDLDCRVTYFNQRFADLMQKRWGVKVHVGLNTLTLHPPEIKSYWEKIIARVFEGHTHTEQFEWNYSGEETRHYELIMRPIFNKGKVIGAAEFNRDITERKGKDKLIKESHDRYDSFVKNSTEAVFCIEYSSPIDINKTEDEQIDQMYKYGYVSEANDEWARIAGFEHGKELVGARLEEITPRSIPENIIFYRNFIRSQYRLSNFETVEEYKSGKKIVASNTVIGIIEDGHLIRAWGTGRDITENKRLENDLLMHKNDLQTLAGRLISNQEKELTRLARELHDDLTQQLAVTAIEAGSIEQDFKDLPELVLNKIVRIKEQLIKISKDVHNISRDLHPSILVDLGLIRAVQSECSNFSARTGIAVNFIPKNVPDKIPKDIALSAYRTIQEGLSNIAKHADVKNSSVFLEMSGGSLIVIVRDTGIGFDQTKVRQQAALGLGSIRERARLINGKSSIMSTLGKGTTIEVRIPL